MSGGENCVIWEGDVWEGGVTETGTWGKSGGDIGSAARNGGFRIE